MYVLRHGVYLVSTVPRRVSIFICGMLHGDVKGKQCIVSRCGRNC